MRLFFIVLNLGSRGNFLLDILKFSSKIMFNVNCAIELLEANMGKGIYDNC